MSSPAISLISSSTSLRLSHVFPAKRNAILYNAMSCCRVCPLKPPSLNRIFIRTHMGPLRKPPFSLPPDPFLQLWNGRIARQGLKLMCLLPWLIIVTLIEKQFPIGCHSFHLSRFWKTSLVSVVFEV
ncbi:uncharacterized protein LOC120135364 [Hibiscus syriacus]|uniref:uncharacterized protein LOC120135364 n=1 Tax=Hibiscus syriacus TaxID=106335 RepID=UPI001920B48C|nr:uncharacterized protein LOC120135364 [Hibiscus syriacus]